MTETKKETQKNKKIRSIMKLKKVNGLNIKQLDYGMSVRNIFIFLYIKVNLYDEKMMFK